MHENGVQQSWKLWYFEIVNINQVLWVSAENCMKCSKSKIVFLWVYSFGLKTMFCQVISCSRGWVLQVELYIWKHCYCERLYIYQLSCFNVETVPDFFEKILKSVSNVFLDWRRCFASKKLLSRMVFSSRSFNLKTLLF